jgi:enamine deaminase RidA (YjgF/YER057c/UK114 family)
MAMKQRQSVSTGAKWESIVGYSRAVRIGNQIEISGTCAVDDEGRPYAPNNPYEQTRRIFQIVAASLDQLGGKLEDVIRTRIFVTDIQHWQEVGRAHGEIFHLINPVTTMVEVSKLISPEFLVEIEVSAIVHI